MAVFSNFCVNPLPSTSKFTVALPISCFPNKVPRSKLFNTKVPLYNALSIKSIFCMERLLSNSPNLDIK